MAADGIGVPPGQWCRISVQFAAALQARCQPDDYPALRQLDAMRPMARQLLIVHRVYLYTGYCSVLPLAYWHRGGAD
jgi:hypothetical protein